MSDNNNPEAKAATTINEAHLDSTEEVTTKAAAENTTTATEAKKEASSETALKSTSTSPTVNSNAQQQQVDDSLAHPPEKVRLLKEAFPDTDIDVIEAVLQTQNDNVESTFELLLSMSDTNYKPENTTTTTTTATNTTMATDAANENINNGHIPTMPPRPAQQGTDNTAHPPYTYWQRQEPRTVEEQLRMDEELAKKIAMEDEMRAERRRQRHLQQQQQQQQQTRQRPQQEEDDDSLFNFQEELPIIKEKVIEAGKEAKKKVMDFFNQIKANTQKAGASSSSPTMNNQQSHINARYRGLPGNDDGDDLLTGDISALHLSDYDVYAKTGGRLNSETTHLNATATQDGVIHVNPPLETAGVNKVETSTSDAQLKADEDFARQLAAEEEQRANRRRSTNKTSLNTDTTNTSSSPQMPPRKFGGPTLVIAPKSPLEFDSDYEDVRLTAAPSDATNKTTAEHNSSTNDADATVPYVIGDDDDDDSDNLVNIQDDEEEVDGAKKKTDDTLSRELKNDDAKLK